MGVDIGGTFTDVALEDAAGRLFSAKHLTTHEEPSAAVLSGIAEACDQAGIAVADIGQIIHGTTLATNALIERRGARTLFVTTEGFRDVLEMGTESRFDQYDLNIVKPTPLVPRSRRITVRERLDVEGETLVPLEKEAIEPVLDAIDTDNIGSVAVGLLHSYANPAHEQALRDAIRARRPDMYVSLSSDVSPEMREYQRFSTTVANAYVQPVVAAYLKQLEQSLAAAGFDGALMVMLSNGGLATLGTAIRFPVRLVESGPAGGAIYAGAVAQQAGADQAVSFDMGGTTAKICLIDRGRPQTAREFEVDRAYRFKRGSGLPLRIPVVEMVEIGAGGGSLCGVNTLGMITVGPRSAGSEPGPACYGRGGTGATVTDANLQVGRIDPDRFAGGAMALDSAAAQAALDRDVGQALGLDEATAAVGVVEMVDENMANAAREHAVEHGKELAGRTMIAFGGCAPLHAARLAEKLGIDRIIVPPGAGVGSAIGFLRAPVAYEVARSLYQRLGTLDVEAASALMDSMEEEAAAFVRNAAGQPPEQIEYFAFMRYAGQSHEIMVALPDERPGADNRDAWIAEVADTYARTYRQQFGPPIDGIALEIIAWTVRAACLVERPRPGGIDAAPGETASAMPSRTVIDTASGAPVEATVHMRNDLPAGTTVEGPAIIVEDQTSTVAPPGFNVRVEPTGALVIMRQEANQA